MHISAPRVVDRSWVFGYGNTKESTLKPLCRRVEAQLDLPAGRLCRYFAGSDDEYLTANPRFGRHFRGFHATVAYRNFLPKYNSTCDDPTGLVECYAHELQHFVQHGRTPRLSAANSVLTDNLKRLEPTSTVIDIPTEKEANIVSKRVTETVCGVEEVKRFAEERVRFMDECGEHEERDRWIFFRDTPASTSFNLLDATLPLVAKYKGVLDFRMDVDKPEWWVGPLEDDVDDD